MFVGCCTGFCIQFIAVGVYCLPFDHPLSQCCFFFGEYHPELMIRCLETAEKLVMTRI